MIQRLAPLILAFSLVGGCAASHPDTSDRRYSRMDRGRVVNDQVFAVGYQKILDIHLEPVPLRQLTLDGLQGLSRLDPEVGLKVEGSSLFVMVGTTMVADFPLPKTENAAHWGILTARVVERLRAASTAVAKADTDGLYQAVFDAIVADLDDYSRYTGGRRAVEERSQRDGYGGIGIAVRHGPGRHEITEIVPGSPAARAGIQVGELVLAIDGHGTAGMSDAEIGDRLRGPAGTVVAVTIGRMGDNGRRLDLRRDRVIPSTVRARADGLIGILSVERFNAATALHLREGAQRLLAEIGDNAKGFVLDLRNNPGGLLDQAVAVADLFIDSGRIISTRGRHPDSLQRYDATSGDILDGRPLIVLTDGRSASAAEVVAAALQDAGRAVVVGASSFGKGSVQTVTRLPNDGELFLTWSLIYAPSGYTLHRQGVLPTVCTSSGAAHVEEALQDLRHGTSLPTSTVALWKAKAPSDPTVLAQLRETCPWKEHAPEIDLQVAEALLLDPPLYRQALTRIQTHVAER